MIIYTYMQTDTLYRQELILINTLYFAYARYRHNVQGHRHLHACMHVNAYDNIQGAYNVGIYTYYYYIYVQAVGH